ncbi:MAG: hypothetical protein IBX52_08675 [Bacterioplanes sp.]|nr:hypothetical protein [Bacterioplanes sp.]
MRYLRSMALTTLCFYAVFTTMAAQAQITTELEQQLYQLSLDSHMLLIKYYHVQAEEGKRELLHDVVQRQYALEQAWQTLADPVAASHPEQFAQLQTYWQRFNDYLSRNLQEINDSHFPELQVVILMRDQIYLFMRQLDQVGRHWQQQHDLTPSSQQQLLRDQQRLLLTVVERYIERAASSMGAPLTIDGEDMQSLTQRFSKGLSVIEKWPHDSANQQRLRRIHSQWQLIARTATNNEQRLVPYLIMRYTDNLMTGIPELQTAATQTASTQ